MTKTKETQLGRTMRRMDACAERYEAIMDEKMLVSSEEFRLALHVATQPQRSTAVLGSLETIEAYDIDVPEEKEWPNGSHCKYAKRKWVTMAAVWVTEFEGACRVSDENASVDDFKKQMMS